MAAVLLAVLLLLLPPSCRAVDITVEQLFMDADPVQGEVSGTHKSLVWFW